MNNGSAVLHINGVPYPLADQYTDRSSGTFLDLETRIDKLVKGTETNIQHFEVLINGNKGRLTVRPSGMVSAAVVFVPAVETQIY